MRQLSNGLAATLLIPLMVVGSLSAGSQTVSPQSTPPATASAAVASSPPALSPVTPALTAKDIQGLDVFSSDGQQVGKIAKVNAPDGRVKDVEVQSAGFMGLFSKTYLLPADRLSKKGGRVELSMTSEQARQFIK
jgi:sporulation protein YlmC with PRC-barrel domain